jgi:hypothetical protein
MAGFGTAPIGTSPFGIGTPISADPPPSTSAEQGSFINFRTRDYELDDEGEFKRMPITRQRVLMLLSTELGSATAVPGVGLRLPRKIDKRFPQVAQQSVRDALAPIGADIRIDAVTPRTFPGGRADILVAYTDLTTGNSDTVTI